MVALARVWLGGSDALIAFGAIMFVLGLYVVRTRPILRELVDRVLDHPGPRPSP